LKKEIFKIDNKIDISKTLPEKIETSLDVISKVYQKSKEQEIPLFVNFSGGKDSSAVLLLAKEIAPKNTEAIYMTTRLELPGTVEFVKKEADRLGIYLHITDPVIDYMGDFAHWVKHYGYFPSFGYNFCNSRMKEVE
jgi:3'-phosphoadenosine 5'-phosphosulfate sulfotransferase (PAPS reductase)/FAD synthetase